MCKRTLSSHILMWHRANAELLRAEATVSREIATAPWYFVRQKCRTTNDERNSDQEENKIACEYVRESGMLLGLLVARASFGFSKDFSATVSSIFCLYDGCLCVFVCACDVEV